MSTDSPSAPTSLPFETIKGETLSSEQRSYLEGLFCGLKERGFSFADVEPAPRGRVPEPIPENLIFEERVKRELHPLDAYPLLLENALGQSTPERENIFRFKWHGLFHLTPQAEAFMARLRIPAGQVKTFQLREIARLARELTSGYIQITTRANLQLRLIKSRDAPEFLRRIQNVGLHTRGAGADNIRNITANPTAGIDPCELIDTSPFCHELAQLIINNREFYDLPRKFNIAFDGGGLIGSVEDTNDLGVRAVRIRRDFQELKAGVCFRISAGGATGHQTFARDLGVLVPPDRILNVIAAMVRVYIAHGNRTDRKKARLKHLLDSWPLEKYLSATEALLGWKLTRTPAESSEGEPLEESPRINQLAHPHIGVFPQKQAGLNYIGVAVPVGEITPKQLLRLAEIADLYASGEIRLTVWQNLVIPNIPDGYVETVKKALLKAGLDWRQSHLRSGLIACTGNAFCKFASSNTKAHALEIAGYLEKRLALDQPLNIHLTGCPNSCAQHYMGDIGLLGTKVKVSGETVEGYHVFVGGGFGADQAVGRQVFQGISVEQLKPTIEKMLSAYLAHRQAEETFHSFTRRHDLNALQTIFSEGV
jgi:ferredoxin-nitrite reductase